MSSHDALQRVGAAAAAIIDTDAAVVALTGRASGNIVRFDPRTPVVPNSLAYLATEATLRGGIGEAYDVTLVLRAEADGNPTVTSESAPEFASKLLGAALDALAGSGGVAAFAAAGADAVVTTWKPHTPEDSGGDPPSTNPAVVAAEAELTVWITL